MTQEPEKFGKYKVEKVLGEGAMGIVYAAYDPGIGRQVAIKTVHAHLLQGDEGEELLRRFTREVRAVGKLSHPNIVGIFDTDEASDGTGAVVPYFVMEFVNGRDLADYLVNGARFSLPQVIDMACQMLDAFEYTHKLGIVHRDVKPANIFLTDDHRIKIADFGIARVDNSNLTQTGTTIGTPSYMSPEQCTGQAMDGRSDLFSIAVVVYELLTGEKPFSANSAHAIMMKLVQSNPEPPSVFNPSLPSALDAVIARALAKAPDERFQTASEFARALEPFKHGSAGQQSEANNASSEATVVVSAGERAGPASASGGASSRRALLKALVGGVAAALLLSIGVGAYLLSGNEGAGTDASQTSAFASGGSSGAQASAPVKVQPFANELPLQTQQKVEKLLKVADVHEKAGRLIFPAGSSAHYVYNTVFELDPGNPRARQGMREMERTLEQQAQTHYENRDFKTLQAHLKASLEAFPDNKKLQQMQQELNQLEAQSLEDRSN